MASLTSLYQYIQQSSIEFIGPKQTTIDLVGGILCKICRLTFATKQSYDSHYRSHGASTEIIYTCNICYKEVTGYPNFRGHCYTSHVIKERFQCEHCFKQFSKISNLKDHVNRVHKFKCPTCRKEFPSKKEMLLHQIIHDNLDQPPYNCNTCKIEIDTADECKEHVEKHLKFLYSCPICNDNISNKENATEHMKKHFDNVLIQEKNDEETPQSEDTSEEFSGIMCQFCSLILGDRVKFDAHFSCKHGDEDIVYMCVECGKSFEKYSVFKNHCYDHTVRNRYKCEICNKAFPRLSMLAAHTAACQAAGSARGQKVFGCPVCSRRFASMWRWREHLRVAHDIQRHLPCPHDRCDRTFDTPKQLMLHQQTHEITNHNFCSQCRLVFSDVASCERHIDTHKKKVFFCPICKRNAKDKKVIMNHIAQHFEVVSHLCRICGRISNSKKSLIEHLKIHKKVKSYSCTHCNKSFLKPSQLEQHVNTHTGVKPYKCPICVKSFSNYPNWVKHVRRMHHEESVYIRNPITDQTDTDSIDKEDSIMETEVIENDLVKSNNLLNIEICIDNKNVNNNYQVTNTNEQISNMNIDRNFTTMHHIKSIDYKNSVNDNSVNINDTGITVQVAVNEKYEVSNDITIKSHRDENNSNFVDLNNMNRISIFNHVVEQTVGIKEETYAIETSIDKESKVTKNSQKDDIEHISIVDEQISNTSICSKPHKCPICDKTFAKYSYMSKHVCRVHHIRSIDIKNLITDHKESVDGDNSVLETSITEENEISIDNAKGDNDEQVFSTDKLKIPINSNIEHHLHDSKPYKCPICDKSFAKYPYMKKHVRKIHHKKTTNFKNPMNNCIAIVDEISTLETGVDEEMEISKDIAKNDNKYQFSNLANHSIGKPYKCPICDKSFAKHPYMTKHIRKVHNKKHVEVKNTTIEQKEIQDEEISAIETFADGECDISVEKEENSVQIQMIEKNSNAEHPSNTGPKPYSCPRCDKSFAKHSYMSKHIRTVHNKKTHIDIKNPITDNKESLDEDGSAMETVVDEEIDIFTDHSKDDNDDRIQNTDHNMDTDNKPYKCHMCEKSFAQDRYCRKHIRRVHYKKNMDIKSPIFDPKQSSIVNTFIKDDKQVIESQDYLKNEIPNMPSIDNIINETETTDCLNDIDDANASIDFANVKLESYIFSVQRETPMDITPSISSRKYLVNDNNNGETKNNSDLFKKSNNITESIRSDIMFENKGNTPIGTELVNENGEAIAVVEKDLFNANSKENATIEKDLFSGNTDENENPIDILEYIAEMPDNNSLFVPVINQESLAGSSQPPAETVSYPYEYGPEFAAAFDAPSTAGFIDLDDHMLPHIDPLLTINNETCVQMQSNHQAYDYNVIDAADLLALGNEACTKMYTQNDQTYNEYNVTVATAGYEPGWDPPVLTKLCDQYSYGYGEMPEASRVPIMNTDIF